MFVTNVVLANNILDRGFFYTLKEATYHANQQTKEKIWKLPNGSVFFGDVEVRVYNTDDYKNEHFLSFIDSCWNCPHVLWPTCCQDSIGDLSDVVYCMVLFKSARVHSRKRTLHEGWKEERLPTRTFETPYDNVGGFESQKLYLRVWDWDCFDPRIHS